MRSLPGGMLGVAAEGAGHQRVGKERYAASYGPNLSGLQLAVDSARIWVWGLLILESRMCPNSPPVVCVHKQSPWPPWPVPLRPLGFGIGSIPPSSHSSDLPYQVLAPRHLFPCPLSGSLPLSHSPRNPWSCGWCSCLLPNPATSLSPLPLS